jgi:hypothetical protein
MLSEDDKYKTVALKRRFMFNLVKTFDFLFGSIMSNDDSTTIFGQIRSIRLVSLIKKLQTFFLPMFRIVSDVSPAKRRSMVNSAVGTKNPIATLATR